MRHFERIELVARYDAYRPRVHGRVIDELASSFPDRRRNRVLDVACGTGHSAEALKSLAPAVFGSDISAAMLARARVRAPGVRMARAAAERLPYLSACFDLVTVSMALHWFDTAAFLREAARVLRPDGELFAYNLVFPGVLPGDDSFAEWHRSRYLERYPVPQRHWDPLEKLLSVPDSPLRFIERRAVEYEVRFDASELRCYLTTQSNVDAALEAGEALRDVDAWLSEELAPFFAVEPIRSFAYPGLLEVAVSAGSIGESRYPT